MFDLCLLFLGLRRELVRGEPLLVHSFKPISKLTPFFLRFFAQLAPPMIGYESRYRSYVLRVFRGQSSRCLLTVDYPAIRRAAVLLEVHKQPVFEILGDGRPDSDRRGVASGSIHCRGVMSKGGKVAGEGGRLWM